MASKPHDFIKLFAELAVERLARAESALARVEADPSANQPLVDLGRELHSIKGEANLLGLSKIFRVAQLGEELLRHVRSGTKDRAGSWSALREGLALCARLVDALPSGAEVDLDAFEASVRRLLIRIVVAEDSPLTLGMFTRILEAKGYEVYGASDGVEAMKLILEQHPHALVTDIEMPRMDGFELIRTIRAKPGTKHLPVIVVTARDSTSDWEQGVELGISAYLIKANFKAELLTEVVERTLASW
jgi:CheY-like chemotaxis protein